MMASTLIQLCALAYPTVHDAVQQALQLGCGTLLGKIDIEQAFEMSLCTPRTVTDWVCGETSFISIWCCHLP